MQMLVSVRSAAEAAAARLGGAHIIDAKEPSAGSLGPVSPSVLQEIADQVPPDSPLSVALGDIGSIEEAGRAIAELDLGARPGGIFVKLGFAAGSSELKPGELIGAAVTAAARSSCRPQVVAVAYADHVRIAAPAPDVVMGAAIDNGASGILLDTAIKDGRGLTGWLRHWALLSFVGRGRRAGLLTALAGSLGMESLPSAIGALPDVIGVRGAACAGGRHGVVEVNRVRALVTLVENGRLAKRHARSFLEPVAEASNQE